MASAATARALLPGISELLEKQRYKEALDQIKKKLKKSQDPSIYALRAQVLLEYGDIPACAQQCKELLARKPPLKDTVTVSGLYAVLAALAERSESGIKAADLTKVWQDAIAQQPSAALKAEYAIDWAGEAVHLGLWGQVAQAAGAAQRHLLPADRKRRQYFFWQQVGNWLSSTQPGSDSRMSVMVVRSLEMALKNMPEEELKPVSHSQFQVSVKRADKQQDAVAGNWISNKAEFALLKEVFLNDHDPKKLLSMLDEKSPQPSSESLALDSWGVAGARIAALTDWDKETDSAELSLRLWTLVRDIIESSQKEGVQWKADKFDFWASLVSSLTRMGFPNSESSATLELLDTKPQTRTKTLARVMYWQNRMKTLSGPNDPQSLLDALQAHLTLNMKNPLCSDDTLSLVHDASVFQGEQLHNHCAGLVAATKPDPENPDSTMFPWLYTGINALKCEYAAVLASNAADDRQSRLQELAYKGIEIYHTSRTTAKLVPKTARHPGDEAALTAARILLDISKETDSQWPMLQAVTLLSHVSSNAESNFDARSLLLSPLQALGMFSLAESQYKGLVVKSILNENSAPRLFTRISTLAPLKDRTRDIVESMRVVLQWYSSAVSTTPDYQEKALDHTNYQQSIHMEHFKQRLQHSATRQMLRLECRRAARLGGSVFNERGLRFDTHAPREDETVDRSFAPNDADKIPKGPHPTKVWLQAMSVVDAGFEVAQITSEQSTQSPSKHIIDDAALEAALTAAELGSYRLMSLVTELSQHLSSPTTVSTDKLTSLLTSISTQREANMTRLRTTLQHASSQNEPPFPGWQLPHEAYHILDTDRAVSQCAARVSSYVDDKLKKADKDTRAALKAAAKALSSTTADDGPDSTRQLIRTAVLEIVQKIEKLEADGGLFEGVFGAGALGSVGRKLLELMGETAARRSLEVLARSATDGLEMMLRVPRL